MFERFTDPARQVVVHAQDEARDLRHDYIGTEHLLLGLLRPQQGTYGLAARALDSLGVTVEAVRARVHPGKGEYRTMGQIPFLQAAKRALEASAEQMDALGHHWIGTEHLLLGLVADENSVGSRILEEIGAPPARVRDEILRLLQGHEPA